MNMYRLRSWRTAVTKLLVLAILLQSSPIAVLAVGESGMDVGGQQSEVGSRFQQSGITRGVITGEVFNASTGLPLPNTTVQVVDAGANAPIATVTDSRGRYRLVHEAGEVRLAITQTGYTSAARLVQVTAGLAVAPLDAQLTPLDLNSSVLAAVVGGAAADASGQVVLLAPLGSLLTDVVVQLTALNAQALVAPPPIGWSPVAAVDLAPAGQNFAAPVTLSLPAPDRIPADAWLVAAAWDRQQGLWIALPPPTISADGVHVEIGVRATGQYALFVADAPPNAPPSVMTGQPLLGIAAPPPAELSATISPSPRILLTGGGESALVTVQAAAPLPMASGAYVQVDTRESYTLVDGAQLYPEPVQHDLLLYPYPAGSPLTPGAQINLSPSRPFALHELVQGAIDLAVRTSEVSTDFGSPDSQGILVTLDGATVDAGRGQRLVAPRRAADDLPLLLTPLPLDEFPPMIPPGLNMIDAMSIDLHGARFALPAALSIPRPVALPANAQVLVVRIADVDRASYLSLLGPALATGDGRLQFNGVLDEGRYAFLQSDQPLGFITGAIIGGAGESLANRIASINSFPLASITGPEGRYIVAAPPGAAILSLYNPATHDTLSQAVVAPAVGSFAQVNTTISAVAPRVVGVFPPDGAVDVALLSTIQITLSEPVAPASVVAALQVVNGQSPVAGAQSLTPNGMVLTFRPDAPLPDDAAISVTLSTVVQDLAGNPLAAPFDSHFTTVDVTPPPLPPAGQIQISVPDESGFCIVTGTQGTVEPGDLVLVKNLTTGEITSILPDADGSFRLAVPAGRADKLQLLLQDASGNQSALPTPRFQNPDGTVVVGADGGAVEGAGGLIAEIPAGALPPGATVKIEPASEGDFPQPAPASYPFIGGVNLILSANAIQPLDISVPAPPNATADDTVLVAQFVTWRGGQGWMVVDRAGLANGRYTTKAPPGVAWSLPKGKIIGLAKPAFDLGVSLPGTRNIVASGRYAILGAVDDCTSYLSVAWDFFGQVAMIPTTGPFVYFPTQEATSGTATIPARCGSDLEIEVRDADTNLLLQRISQKAPATRHATVKASTSDDKKPPRIVQHNLYSFRQTDQLRIVFSEPMSPTSVLDGLKVTDEFGDEVSGDASLVETDTVLLFTPTVPATAVGGLFTPTVGFQFNTRYNVEINDAVDQSGAKNALTLSEPLRFTTFKPRTITEFDDVIGAAPGTQAIANVREFVFSMRTITDPTTTQALAVLDSYELTDPVKIGEIPVGLAVVRSMVAIPDVFATLSPGISEPDELFTRAVSPSVATSITNALDRGAVTEELAEIFDAYDGGVIGTTPPGGQPGEARPFRNRVRLSRRASAEAKRTGQEWLITNRGRVYLLKIENGSQITVYTGRDLLVIAGSPTSIVGDLEVLDIWDVTACTQPPTEGVNCTAEAIDLGRKALADPIGSVPRHPYIPREPGVPTQLAVLHNRLGGAIVVYVVNVPLGIQAVDITRSANLPGRFLSDPGPHGLIRGHFSDVSVVKNLVLVGERDSTGWKLSMFTPQLARLTADGGAGDPIALDFGEIVAIDDGPDVVVDMDGDGNVGAAEDTDSDSEGADGNRGIDEVFDLALVVTRRIADASGAVWVVDLSSLTDLKPNRYAQDADQQPRIVAGVPLPLPAQSLQFDPGQKTAYVESNGLGLYFVDLRHLVPNLAKTTGEDGRSVPERLVEQGAGEDELDARIVGLAKMLDASTRGDIVVDFNHNRPIAYANRYNAGIELIQVCNGCQELVLDFKNKDTFVDQNRPPRKSEEEASGSPGSTTNNENQPYLEEKQLLLELLQDAAISLTTNIADLLPTDFFILEQGSGGCFWNKRFTATSAKSTCQSFNPGSSDHDFELFLPSHFVRRGQTVLDEFMRNPPSDRYDKLLADLSLYAMPKEPFVSGVLLNSPPMNKEGDTAGDLGMGRQTLLLLWLLTAGEYVPLAPPYTGNLDAPNLDRLLECVRLNQIYDTVQRDCNPAKPMYPGQPTGIPMSEGYEWSLLQEYNVYKTGAMLRVVGGCNFANPPAQGDAINVSPYVNEELDVNHPDLNFSDNEALKGGCKSQLRTIGKGAIRTVLARLLADPQGNAMVMSGRYAGYAAIGQPIVSQGFISTTRDTVQAQEFCLTGLPNDGGSEPSNDALRYQAKRCDGFEEFIATMAIESVRRGYTIFTPDELPRIWNFWCVKVWDGCKVNGKSAVPIKNDDDAVEFIRSAIDFIGQTQQATRATYDLAVATDTISTTSLMQLQGMTAYPFGQDICSACSSIGASFTMESTRGNLRNCNLEAVTKKIAGKDLAAALHYFEDGHFLLFPDKSQLDALKAKLGVRNYVQSNLRTRLSNISPNDLYSVTVALYEGKAADAGDYADPVMEYDLPYLPAGGRTLVDVETVPFTPPPATTPETPTECTRFPATERAEYVGTAEPKTETEVNLFPALFAVAPTLEAFDASGQAYRALAFVADPEQEYVEADKKNNQVGFYYWMLDAGQPTQPTPATPKSVPLVLTDFEPNAICRSDPWIDFDLTFRVKTETAAAPGGHLAMIAAQPAPPALDSEAAGTDDATILLDEEIEVVYTLRNRSDKAIHDIQVQVNGEVVEGGLKLEPFGSLRFSRDFVGKQAGVTRLTAIVNGTDEDGNGVAPQEDEGTIDVERNLRAFEMTLYDATALNSQTHPFTRYNLHHDTQTGAEIPIVGAVTDGAARVRIDVTGLSADEPADARLEDFDISDETEGIGILRLEGSSGEVITSGVHISLTTPGAIGSGQQLYYIPPSGFVRNEHYMQDQFRHQGTSDTDPSVPRIVRKVRLSLDQAHTGYSAREIRLMRPPVFLFHGLGGDPRTWKDFHPIVPPGGVSLDPYTPVSGYDGRFLVFNAGSFGTVNPIRAEAKENEWRFRAALHVAALADYAIAKVDIVGNSMGGLISRQIAWNFVHEYKLDVPIHKLITIDTPHLGSPIPNQIIAVRNQASLLDLPGALPDLLNPDPTDPRMNDPNVKDKQAAMICATLLQSLSGGNLPIPGYEDALYMPELDSSKGAVDDLSVGSPAILRLQNAGTLVPTHYIAGEMNTSNLGEFGQIKALWVALGLLCNWTPDNTTVATTEFYNSLALAASLGKYVRIVGTLIRGGGIKNLLGRTPIPLLDEGNDRIVETASQLDGHTIVDPAVTLVEAPTDHLDIKVNYVGEFLHNVLESCYQQTAQAWASPAHRPPHALTHKDQMPCQVIFLLETDGSTDLFNQPDPNAAPIVSAGGAPRLLAPAAPLAAPASLSAAAPTQQTALDTTLQILTPAANTIVRPGQSISVTVAAPATPLIGLVAAVGSNVAAAPAASLTTQISVPMGAVGPLDLNVYGVDADDNFFAGATTLIVNAGLPTRLTVQGPRTLVAAGQVAQLQVVGSFAGGVERDLTLAQSGTTYESTDPSVVAVSANGLVQGRKNGRATIRVRHKDAMSQLTVLTTAAMEVAIPNGPSNGIPIASAAITPTITSQTLTMLSALASSDPDNDTLTFHWVQTGGRVVYLDRADTATPYFISPRVDAPAVLRFELTVSDGKGAATLPVTVQVTVTP